MFSRAGSTRTQIAGRQSLGTNLIQKASVPKVLSKSSRLRSERVVHLLAGVEEDEPPRNWKERQEKLASNREQERKEK